MKPQDPAQQSHAAAPHPPLSRERIAISVMLCVLLGMLLAVVTFIALHQKKTPDISSPPASIAIPTPTPKPLPGGKQTYRLSHGKDVQGPKPATVVIDPLTPTLGEQQTVTVIMAQDTPVTRATLALHTDNETTDYPLRAVSPDTWEASWTMNDSYDYLYYLQLHIQNETGVFQNGLKFR